MKLVQRSRTENPNEYIYLYDKLFLIFFQRRDGTPHFFRGNILHQSRDTMLEEKRKAHMLHFGSRIQQHCWQTWNGVGLLKIKYSILAIRNLSRTSTVNCDVRYSLYMSYSTILY